MNSLPEYCRTELSAVVIRLEKMSAGASSRLLTNNYLRAFKQKNGAPDRIDSDRLRAIFTPLGRLRRLKRWRVLSNNVRLLGRDTPGKQKRARKGPIFIYWRARQDSNL